MSKVEKRTGYFESFDGNKTYYEIRGEGTPIIYAYGLACQFNHWIHQVNYFSNKYQTILFDYRGHHKTDIPLKEENLSIKSIAKDIELLCEHLNIKKAHFVGHSFGVPILLELNKMNSDLALSFVFINGFVKNPIRGMFGLQEILERFFYQFKKGHLINPNITTAFWKSVLLSPIAVPSLSLAGGFNFSLTNLKDIEIYSRGVAMVDLDVFLTLFEDMLHYDGEDILSLISDPCLIISGRKDTVTPKFHQTLIAENVQRPEVLHVPYGSHCTQLDFPEFVNLRMEKFYKDHYPKG